MIDTDLATLPSTETQVREQLAQNWLNDTVIVPAPDKWYLCSMSEAYLGDAIDRGTVTVVNDALVVKPIGKLAGLCIRDVMGPSGEALFKKGYWYCPVGECRQDLQGNFDSSDNAKMINPGRTRMFLARSQWAKMKIAMPDEGQTLDDYVQAVVDAVAKLPQGFKVEQSYQEAMSGISEVGTTPHDLIQTPVSEFNTTQDYLMNHILGGLDRDIRIGLNVIGERTQFPIRETSSREKIPEELFNKNIIQSKAPSFIKENIPNEIKMRLIKSSNLNDKKNEEKIIDWDNSENKKELGRRSDLRALPK